MDLRMNRKTNTALIALLGTILMGLSTYVLVTIIELQYNRSYDAARTDVFRQSFRKNLCTYG